MTDSPNDLLTAENIAATAAAIAGQDLGLGALVFRSVEAGFGDGSGATVKVAIPGAVQTHTRGVYSMDELITGKVAEKSIDISLDYEAYNVVPLSRGDLDLDIRDFAKQILRPQALSVVKHVERAVATAMSATELDPAIAYDSTKPKAAFVAARRTLRTNGVDASAPLRAIVGANVYADLLLAEAIDDGGKVAGVEVHESTRIDADDVVVFIREAFALAVRAPAAPEGAPFSASAMEEGFALTHIRAFDASTGTDKSIVSAFVGAKALPLPVDNEDGTITLVAGGGAVRFSNAA